MYLNTQPTKNYAFAIERMASLAQTANSLYYQIITPVNYHAEKEAWLRSAQAGKFTQPQFCYDQALLTHVSHLEEEFCEHFLLYSEIGKEESLQAANLEQVSQGVLTQVLLLLDRRLRALSRNVFQRATFVSALPAEPSEPQVSVQALQMSEVSLPTPAELDVWRLEAQCWQPQCSLSNCDQNRLLWANKRKLSAEQAVEVFNEIFRTQHYCNVARQPWRAEVSSRVSAVTVIGEQARLQVPTQRTFTAAEVAKLIAHEIEGHVRARINTEALFARILRQAYGEWSPFLGFVPLLAKSPDETLNEGVAKFNEVRLLGEQKTPAPFYGLAIDLAFRQHASFSEVAHEIYSLRRLAGANITTATRTAWNAAYRVFRGGGVIKDVCYKRGYNLVAPIMVGNPEMGALLADYATLSLGEILELQRAGLALKEHWPEHRHLQCANYWLQSQLSQLLDD